MSLLVKQSLYVPPASHVALGPQCLDTESGDQEQHQPVKHDKTSSNFANTSQVKLRICVWSGKTVLWMFVFTPGYTHLAHTLIYE